MKTSRAAAGVAAALLVVGAAAVGSQSASSKAEQDLGAALFRETALTNPGSDFRASCDTCHHVGTDPRGGGGGNRFYSDGSPRSLMPGHGSVVQETTLRNTPSLLDLDRAPRLGLDGRYVSLDDLLRDKLVSPHLGWKEPDRARAVANLQNVLMNDARTDYRALFQAAYRVDVEGLDEEQAREQVVRALDRLRAQRPLRAHLALGRLRRYQPHSARAIGRRAAQALRRPHPRPDRQPGRSPRDQAAPRLRQGRLRRLQDLLPRRGHGVGRQLRRLPRPAHIHQQPFPQRRHQPARVRGAPRQG